MNSRDPDIFYWWEWEKSGIFKDRKLDRYRRFDNDNDDKQCIRSMVEFLCLRGMINKYQHTRSKQSMRLLLSHTKLIQILMQIRCSAPGLE